MQVMWIVDTPTRAKGRVEEIRDHDALAALIAHGQVVPTDGNEPVPPGGPQDRAMQPSPRGRR